jgi:hypothetical protein
LKNCKFLLFFSFFNISYYYRFPKEKQTQKVSSLEAKKRKALQRQKEMLNKMKKNQELFSENINEEEISDEDQEEPEISCCLCKSELENSTLGPVSLLVRGFSPVIIPLKEDFQVFPIPSQYSVQIHSCFHYIQ